MSISSGRGNVYIPRVIDTELDELMSGLPAIALEGIRGVGKTVTAERRAVTVLRLDTTETQDLINQRLPRLFDQDRPILLDEWQRLPESWDAVRRAVDDGAPPGSFLLTGSTYPLELPAHSGAGRIVSIRMRPLSLAERELAEPTVSFKDILSGNRGELTGETSITVEEYAVEIIQSGLPGIRRLPARLRQAQLDSYIDRLLERDFEEMGHRVRNPDVLLRWLRAYAAATSTTASFETIRDAASSGDGSKPAKTTTYPYRDTLARLFLTDPIPGWLPSRRRIKRLSTPVKHQLADPALAAALMGIDVDALLDPDPDTTGLIRDGGLFGSLFESLVTLSILVYAQSIGARVQHLRTWQGDREIDLIVERRDGKILAIEVKLAATVNDRDVRHLNWLKAQLGPDLLDALIITSGKYAYRRDDGVAVVPACLLGP